MIPRAQISGSSFPTSLGGQIIADSSEVVGGVTSFYLWRPNQSFGGYGLLFTRRRIVGVRARKRRLVGIGLGLFAILILSILEFFFWGIFPLWAWASLPNASPPPYWPIIIPVVVLAMIIVMGDLVDRILGIGPPKLKSGGVDFEVDRDWIRRIEVSPGRWWADRLVIDLKSGNTVEFRMYHSMIGRTGHLQKLLEIVAKFSEGEPMKQDEGSMIWTFK